MPDEIEVPPEFRFTYEMIVCAYPDKIPDADYFALLTILHEEMSFRAVADIISLYDVDQYPYHRVYNDVIGVFTTFKPEDDDVLRVRGILQDCQYAQWVDWVNHRLPPGSD